jgi:phosphate transport system permease protein
MMTALANAPVLATLPFVILAFALLGHVYGARRGEAFAVGGHSPHSRSNYHGWFFAIWIAAPSLILLALYGLLSDGVLTSTLLGRHTADLDGKSAQDIAVFARDAKRLAAGEEIAGAGDALLRAQQTWLWLKGNAHGILLAVVSLLMLGGGVYAYTQSKPALRARNRVEFAIKALLIAASTIAVVTTLGILLSLVFETFRFFQTVPALDFLTGLQWSPQIALRADQAGSSGAFGAVPLFLGTFLIMLIAMLVAVPIGLYAAIYLSEYATPRIRQLGKPVLEVLAGIPTVVYGFFALLTVGPLIRDACNALGRMTGWDFLLAVQAQSGLAAGLVMGVMIIPFISSLSDDVINAVPQSLRDGSFAMGATKSETVRNVVIPAALPGIVGAVLLAISRAIGETMIVTMAASQDAILTANPLEPITTVTVHIVALLTGDTEFDSPKTMSAFALGFVLFVATLILNIIALRVVQKYREKYD